MIEKIISILSYDPKSSFVFTNFAFWIFFAFVLLGNSFLYKKSILRNSFLFICSLFFYYKAGGLYFGILLFSTMVDFFIGRGIDKYKKPTIRKLLLSLSVIINIGVLAYFKYSYFLADIIAHYFHYTIHIDNFYTKAINTLFSTHLDISTIALPVGISFFTFQTISYSVDVYRKKIKAVKSIVDFGFYVSFFPQLVAGPIVRAWEFIPQLHKKYQLSEKWFWWSVWLIMTGLFKKMVISNYLAANLIDRVFDAPVMHSGMELLMGAYAYTLQIYCDFSGYTDIAIGIALILGFRLPQNFNFPYKASSITDFWRRWHISLSLWLRDYLYIPLGGNRKGVFRQCINLLITMLLGGLWHGADWMFVIWGAVHGVALLAHKLFMVITNRFSIKIPRVINIIITFHFVVFTWIIFRSPDISSFTSYMHRMISTFNIYPILTILRQYSFSIFLICISFIIHWFPTTLNKLIKYTFIKSHITAKISFVIIMIIVVYQFSLVDIKPFIYFKF